MRELVQLKWATASEIGNDYFEVERSKDARIWEPMERIKGAGTVNSNQHYAATDTDPLTGSTYYRLKIVEFSGHTDYSVIRSVFLSPAKTYFVYPNPAAGSITFSQKLTGPMKIYNANRRTGHVICYSSGKTGIIDPKPAVGKICDKNAKRVERYAD